MLIRVENQILGSLSSFHGTVFRNCSHENFRKYPEIPESREIHLV